MFRIIAVMITGTLLFPAVSGYCETPEEVNQEERKGVLITTIKAEMKPIERFISLTGELLAEEDVVIKSEVKGKVKEVYKHLGSEVRKGEVIVRIDPEEYKITFEQMTYMLKEAQSRQALAKLSWDRADDLFKKGLISEGDHDQAREGLKGLEATVGAIKASLEMASKKLRDTEIVAPFTGIIREKYVNAGDHVDDKSNIAALVSLTPLKFKTSVPEIMAGVVKVGMRVVIRVEAYPEKVFEGSVIRISPALESRTRTLPIEASFINKDGILKPGFFVEGRIVTKKDDKSIFVPEDSIVSFAGTKKVFVVENNKASERIVKVGERVANMVEVKDGLKPGEIVATSSLNKLSTGVKVEVKK